MIHRAKLFPWGPDRVTRGEAYQLAMFGNVHRKQGSRELRAEDFLPRERKKEMDWAAFQRITWAIGTKAK